MDDRFILERFMAPDRARRMEEVLGLRTSSITVVLENLHKDHNISAILRTCEAFGIQNVHVVPQPGQGKIFRLITRGCHRWLTIVRHDTVADCFEELRRRGYRILAASLENGARPIHDVDWSGLVALVFSNELDGACSDVVERADGLFTVPLAGFSQSLNVSVAAGIVLYHVRQTKGSQSGGLVPLPAAEAGRLLEAWTRRSVRNAGAILGEMRKRGEG